MSAMAETREPPVHRMQHSDLHFIVANRKIVLLVEGDRHQQNRKRCIDRYEFHNVCVLTNRPFITAVGRRRGSCSDHPAEAAPNERRSQCVHLDDVRRISEAHPTLHVLQLDEASEVVNDGFPHHDAYTLISSSLDDELSPLQLLIENLNVDRLAVFEGDTDIARAAQVEQRSTLDGDDGSDFHGGLRS